MSFYPVGLRLPELRGKDRAMETTQTIEARAARLQNGLQAAFGVKARTLEKALKRAGRRLPKRLHKEARLIVDAQRLGGNPKLMQRVDGVALSRAETRVLDHLKGIDRAEARKGRLLGLAGILVFNLLVVCAAFVVWMWWTGQV